MTEDAVEHDPRADLELRPFRAVRPSADGERLSRLLSPPYDVINDAARAELLRADSENAVRLVLPVSPAGGDPYDSAASQLEQAVASGLYRVDPEPAIYVYEMSTADGATTRGLIGAVGLHDPIDGVILPHEDTMAGPVADRLALMTATQANLEPIYLVYEGDGFAAHVVRDVAESERLVETTTPDGVRHRLWAVTDSASLDAIAADLRHRTAVIADGHHRYATYRELQRRCRDQHGSGPWDFGLTLLVNTSDYGPQVHAIHRVLPNVSLDRAVESLDGWADIAPAAGPDSALDAIRAIPAFAVVLTDGNRSVIATDTEGRIAAAARGSLAVGEPAALAELDVTKLHRVVVSQIWGIADTVDNVGYEHNVADAISAAVSHHGCAVLLRPTPVDMVAAVAAAGGRMPRKSTLFTPKPATGLVIRRFADES